MSKFSDLLAAIGLAPKTLPQANETLATAKSTLDSVAALFTSAGLNLEQMLAAGPDALKAHLESVDNTEELAETLQEVEAYDQKLGEAQASLTALNSQLSTFNSSFAALGIQTPLTAKPDEIKTAFEAHVAKQTTLALAKTGHPPAHVPAANAIDDVTPTTTDEDKSALAALDTYIKLIDDDNHAGTKATAAARAKFYAENHVRIDRGMALRRRR